jgi:hypothetical protein
MLSCLLNELPNRIAAEFFLLVIFHVVGQQIYYFHQALVAAVHAGVPGSVLFVPTNPNCGGSLIRVTHGLQDSIQDYRSAPPYTYETVTVGEYSFQLLSCYS